jgi:hypothetical protein
VRERRRDRRLASRPTEWGDAVGEGLSLAEAEAMGGLAVMATVHLLLRVAADDLRPLHFAAAERDLGRIHAEVSLRTDPAAHIGVAPSVSVERLDTARWFFEECGGLDHLRALVNVCHLAVRLIGLQGVDVISDLVK